MDGSWITCEGAWIICDDGYHMWRICQCPIRGAYLEGEIAWSNPLESVRKDVECTFGTMKIRFRILKTGFNYHKRGTIDNIFHACCTLHNILLHHDELDVRWQLGLKR